MLCRYPSERGCNLSFLAPIFFILLKVFGILSTNHNIWNPCLTKQYLIFERWYFTKIGIIVQSYQIWAVMCYFSPWPLCNLDSKQCHIFEINVCVCYIRSLPIGAFTIAQMWRIYTLKDVFQECVGDNRSSSPENKSIPRAQFKLERTITHWFCRYVFVALGFFC